MRRWLKYFALASVFAIACGFLSSWQFHRLEDVRAANAVVAANWDRPPQPLDTVVTALDAYDPTTEWTPVELRGEYLTDEQLLVRNRPLDGRAGLEVLVPFRLEDGSVFVVDRGWVPVGNTSDVPDDVPAPPSGEVVVTARVQEGEPTIFGRTADAGQIPTVHLPAVAELVGGRVYTRAYGILDSESPAVSPMPTLETRPPADDGPHLSYAIQWILFALLGFGGVVWMIRQDRRAARGEAPVPRTRRRPTDADVEDAALDRADSRQARVMSSE